MSDSDFQPDWGEVKRGLAARLREIRGELYGEHGGPLLAGEMKVPFHAWVGYETGASMPGQVMLRFLEVTRTNPHWLLTGEGPKYSPKREGT